MKPLTERKCVACEGGVPPLSHAQVLKLLAELQTGWAALQNHSIKKEYKFPDFKSAMQFVDRVAALAEAEGHHPDIRLSYNRVVIELWTHAVGGLSENDFILAAKIDTLLS